MTTRTFAPWLLALSGLAIVLITVGLGHELIKSKHAAERRTVASSRAAEASATPTPAPSRSVSSPSPTGGTTGAPRPTGTQWRSDVAAVLAGGAAYLDANRYDAKPAIVLDIDNTAVQSYYGGGSATPAVLAFERHAVADGYTVLIATGRTTSKSASSHQLRLAGYTVTSLCTRPSTRVPLQTAKADCRAAWTKQGYTIEATVGNHRTDFEGGRTGRVYSLPNYGFLS